MIDILKSMIISFSMYSKIPMPYIKWNEKSMRFSMCFLPLIGVFIGLVLFLFYKLCLCINSSQFLFSSVCTAIPILINGGIHMDGFIDTMDAVNSHQNIEKKLSVMKDVHVGAFAVIMCSIYFILQFGFWGEIYTMPLKYFIMSLPCFIILRTVSGFLHISVKCAKNSGLAYTFSKNINKKVTLTSYIIWIVLSCLFLIFIDIYIAVLIMISVAVVVVLFKKMCYKNFGGITGDLCGYILQLIELLILCVTVFGGKFICSL